MPRERPGFCFDSEMLTCFLETSWERRQANIENSNAYSLNCRYSETRREINLVLIISPQRDPGGVLLATQIQSSDMLSCFRNPISNKKEEGFFLRNGAAMLEHLIHDFNGKCNPIRMYSVEELSKATNGYKNKSDDLIHEGWNFKLYKGVHQGQEILVKTFRVWRLPASWGNVNVGRAESITNEVAIASNMSNHKNFLKLIGCCLETELPTLVYEFPAKGNLSRHIYRESDHHIGLVWPTKLKIAIQVADAVAYLHYGMAKVIVHQHITAENILLDQDCVAKLSEFQQSVTIPSGETHVDVQSWSWALGRLPPELAAHGRTSEKSDVYSFGILLLELFAGKRVDRSFFQNEGISFTDDLFSDNELACRLLANLCKTYLEDNILEDENKKQVEEYAKLVERCLQINPDERPIMTEVAQLLRSIKSL